MDYKLVLEALQAKKKELAAELDKIEVAIAALTGSGLVAAPAAAPAKKGGRPAKAAAAPTGAKRGPKPKVAASSDAAEPAPKAKRGPKAKSVEVTVPGSYAEARTWNQKVIFAVSQLGKGSVEEIIDFLASQEPGKSADSLKSTVTFTASSLGRKKALKATRDGRKFIYSL